MKQFYFNLSGCLFFLLFVSLSYEMKGQTITIDGDLSDWSTIPYLHTNAEGTGGTLTAIKAIAGENDIFFYIEGTETMTFNQFDLYVDTDNNLATGYIPADYPAGAGAELLIQGTTNPSSGGINSHSGAGGGWGWDWVSGFTSTDITFSSLVTLSGKKAMEFSLKKSLLGAVGNYINFALVDVVDWNPAGNMPLNWQADSKYLQVSTVAGTLPVQLLSFTGSSVNDAVILNWSTQSEYNNSHFEIYRSSDGILFDKIVSVSGTGNTTDRQNYSYTDKGYTSGDNYYQLKQTDINGTVTSLKTITVRVDISGKKLLVYKVPGEDAMEWSIYSNINEKSRLSVSDITGRLVVTKNIDLLQGVQVLRLPLIVKPGIYVTTLVTPSVSLSQKIIIN